MLININENIRTKHYRPNPVHIDVAQLLLQTRQVASIDGPVFRFGYKKVAMALKLAGTKWRPNNMRDFFYNHARKCGVDRDIVDWLAGHRLPGVRAHYLADEIKTEYSKFEKGFRLFNV